MSRGYVSVVALTVIIIIVVGAVLMHHNRGPPTVPQRSGRQPLTLTQSQWPRHAAVPKVVWRTTHLDSFPDHVKPRARGWELKPIFNDEMCLLYLRSYFPPEVPNAFEQHTGAHKADVWRYAVLWREGGIYCDIKSVPFVELDSIHNRITTAQREHDRKFTWYGVIADSRKSMYNGIIATPPGNPIIKALLDDACSPGIQRQCWWKYMRLCDEMARALGDEYRIQLHKGATTAVSPHSVMILDAETCGEPSECNVPGRVGGTARDRYNRCCNAYDADRNLTWQVRDPLYPWSYDN